MTTLRFSLGILWLIVCLGIFLYPIGYLWQARNYQPRRSGAYFSRFAVLGSLKILCWVGATIVVGLGGIWKELESPCVRFALMLFLLGLWLIYFEAPINDLFGADDEEVLGNEEMLSLWYGGLNAKYIQYLKDTYHSEFFSRGKLAINFLRTGAWAWDIPRLRAFAYYLKGQGVMFVSILLSIGIVDNMLSPLSEVSKVDASIGASDLCIYIPMTIFMGVVLFSFACAIRREWMAHYRTLFCAVKEGRDPDLSDRARLAEMRRTILAWGQEKGYVCYDRENQCWKLNEQRFDK